jgi:hypothetical protein
MARDLADLDDDLDGGLAPPSATLTAAELLCPRRWLLPSADDSPDGHRIAAASLDPLLSLRRFHHPTSEAKDNWIGQAHRSVQLSSQSHPRI